MAIADTITSMQTHTSNAYTMIGYGTDLTGINKNLENLSTSIFNAFLESLRNPNTLFTNLPKITGSGSNITLNDTANAPMRITLAPTELTQDSTPTPSSPQDIHTISGSNTIKIESNLFDGAIENKYFNNQNQFINQTGALTTNYIPASEGDKYTISTSISSNGIVIASFDENYNCLSRSATGYDLTLTHTCPAGTKYIIGSNYVGANANTMLNAGNIALPYTPYTLETKDIDLGILGKNYFDGKWEEGGYNSSTGAKNTDTTMRRNVNSIYLQSNEIYIISNNGSGIAMNVLEYKTDGTFIQARTISSGSAFTTASNTAYINIFRGNTNIDKVQIEKGITITSWEAYNPMECGSIGNYENIPIRTSGKNLCNNANNITGYYNGGTFTSDSSYKISDYIPVEVGKTYTGSIFDKNGTRLNNVVYNTFNSSKTYVGQITSADNYTIPDGVAYLRIRNYSGQSSYITSDNYYYQLELGSSSTSFEPYGNGEWYLKQEIGKVVLDGSGNWKVHGSIASWFYADNLIDGIIDNSVTYSMYSNYYIQENYNNVANLTNGQFAYTPTGNKRLVFKNTSCSTANDFKTLLSTHNTDLYYILATPTYTPITGTLASQLEEVYQKMLSYENQTNISQINDDLSFNLSVQAIEEL